MNFACSLNFVDVNILVYLVRRPCIAGIVSFKKRRIMKWMQEGA